jgi:thymidine phosphorylase
MDQPLGRTVGNALEVLECLDVLRGGGPDDLRQLCLELAGWMFYLGGASGTLEQAKTKASSLISSGDALEKFRQMIRLQGGDSRIVDDPGRLPRARHTVDLPSPGAGFLAAIQCEQIGTASVLLGGGRERKEDSIDPAVGIVLHKKVRDPVAAGEPLCTIHYNSEQRLAGARHLIERSYTIADAPPASARPLVQRIIAGEAR